MLSCVVNSFEIYGAHAHTTNISLPKRFSFTITYFVSSWLLSYRILKYIMLLLNVIKKEYSKATCYLVLRPLVVV